MAADDSVCSIRRRRAILAVTEELTRKAKLRNKYGQCIYSFDESGSSAKTQLMRVFDAKDEIRYGKMEDLDEAEIEKIKSHIGEIKAINETIWRLVRQYSYPC